MKNKITQLFAVVVLFSACQTEIEKPKSAVIQAEISNVKSEYLLLNEDYKTVFDTLKIVDGKINTTVSLDENKLLWFSSTRVFIKPGDTIKFKLDENNFLKSLKFEGSSSAENNLFIYNRLHMKRPKYFKDAVKMKSYMDSVLISDIAFTDSFAIANPSINNNFIVREKKRLAYNTAVNKMRYKRILEIYKKITPDNLDDSFYSGIDTLQFEDESMADYYEYTDFVAEIIRESLNKKDENWRKKSKFTYFDFVVDTINSVKVKDAIIANDIYLTNVDEAMQDSLMDFINKELSSERKKASFTKQYENLKTLRKGNPAPMWTAIDRDSTTHSLADFKGKWIYLDVWASWCQPCIKEIPAMKKMEASLKGKNIAFVSISIDNNSDNWKKTLGKYELHGNQFIKPEGESKDFMEDYMIGGVPSFFLIDPDGNIYMKNPPRTSAVEKFDALMEEIKL